MKKFPLVFIQVAWVSEIIAVVLYTMIILPLLPLDRGELWLHFLPVIVSLIGAQGVCAGAGPLISDQIKKQKPEDLR